MKLKTKLTLALAFLFFVILTFELLSVYSLNRLSNESDNILKNNYATLVYDNNMIKYLDMLPTDTTAYTLFEQNLLQQQKNVTEPGEKELTLRLSESFATLKQDKFNTSISRDIRQDIQQINELNQKAILQKNSVAHNIAITGKIWLSAIFAILTIIAFTLVVNFPAVIANPIRALSEGITAVANKQYNKRIHLEQKDEFGDLAAAFNTMAEKLDEYENSNIAQLKFEKTRIETIINQMKDGIIGLDDKQHILFLNKVAEKILGLEETEIMHQYAPDIAVRNDLMRVLLQEDTNKRELKIYADGKESYFNKDIFNVRDNDITIGRVIVLRNITPFHELNEAKTNFIATVSHELKTPISSIKMSAKLLNDDRTGTLNNEQHELVSSVKEDADRLLKITGELLNMTQVETGNIQLKLKTTDPLSILDQAIPAVKFQAQQKNIELKINAMSVLPPIQVDAEKTTWVLINLLTNAIKYSPTNAIIEITVQEKDKGIEFSVVDHGSGIDRKYLPRIFDRYFKVPGTGERSGTGLGLAISKEFIEAQGGTIWVNSSPGTGSVFGFSFNS